MTTDINRVQEELQQCVTAIPDFPKKGIVFRDLSPVWKNAALCKKAIQELANRVEMEAGGPPDAVVGVESRGFIFGMPLSLHWNVPFIPFRKPGKLPGTLYTERYELEYGAAELQCQSDCLKPGMNVLIHDDVLATGGTAMAAQKLVEQTGAKTVGFAFVIELLALQGRGRLDSSVQSLLTY
ncbi:MAG: adenine phosphoribosyltransferase [Bacteroidetes bacterium]|nr:adenine phosphoribosyltransferase [Bacteroidota bacterium]